MPEPRQKIRATADTFVHFLFATPGNENILLSFVNAVQDNAGLSPVKATKVTKRFKTVPQTFEEQIHAITDLTKLEHLADFAYDCESLDEFAKTLK